jgi:hypothetical protein
MSEGKIAVYSVADLKNTTDDALPNYLTSLKFKPNYQIQDIKLVLGYTAVAISAALFYADWKLGWDQTKAYTLPAVVVYFLLNGIFTYWIFYVEKGAIFVGEKGDSKVCTSNLTSLHLTEDNRLDNDTLYEHSYSLKYPNTLL